MGQLLQREVKTIDASTFTGLAQNFGSATAIVSTKASFINASDVTVEIDDGTGQDAIVLPAGATLSVGEGLLQEGKALNSQASYPIGTQLTITAAAGTGTVVAYLFGGP